MASLREKWGKAVTELGGIPLTYCQTGFRSEDYAFKFPEHMLFNNPTASHGFLNGEHSSYSGPNESVIRIVTSQWDEYNVTWNTPLSTIPQNQVVVPQSTNPHQDYEIDVTGMVKYMFDNPSDTHGFLLKLKTEMRYRCLLFASSDNLDPNLHPMLTVSYY